MLTAKNISRLNSIKTFGNSMFPLLLDGDVVYFKKKVFGKIEIDDIVFIKKNRKIFTHRVIYRTERYLITKGDNNLKSDGKIYERNIIGTVYKIKREGQIYDINTLYLIQSTLYFQEIVEIKKALEKARIEHVFLKGLPLHLYYEGKHPKRFYADCDVYIPRKYFYKIRKIFTKKGYKYINSAKSDIQTGLRAKQTEVMFTKGENGLFIIWDVHFEIKFTISHLKISDRIYSLKSVQKVTKNIVKDTTEIELYKNKFLILSKETLLVYLMLHLFRHNFKEIHRLSFINSIFSKEAVNFTKLEKIIVENELQNFIYPEIMLLTKYYKLKFPKTFLQEIRPKSKVVMTFIPKILKINIFDAEGRVDAGITRFRNLVLLSPSSKYKKLFVFSDPKLIKSAFNVLVKKQI